MSIARHRVFAWIAVPCVLVCAGTATSMSDDHADHAPSKPSAPAVKAPTAPQAKKAAPVPKAEPTKHDEHTDEGSTKTEPAQLKHSPSEIKTSVAKASPAASADEPVTADEALKMLQDGNQRWVGNTTESPNTDSSRRSFVASKGQKPFVTVLTCADSRLPVERLFDRGVGEVFVVRVAGNVAGDSETGTIEYGVGHLKTPLLVVMGHTKCGAVAAAASNAELHGKLGTLISHIGPAVERAKRNNPDADEAQIGSIAIRENVWQSIFDLYKYSPEITKAAARGELKVVGAVCDISTGKVDWLGEHPWQQELVNALNTRNMDKAAKSDESKTADAEHHNEH